MSKDGLAPVSEIAADIGLVRRSQTSQARHHFTLADQAAALVEARPC